MYKKYGSQTIITHYSKESGNYIGSQEMKKFFDIQ